MGRSRLEAARISDAHLLDPPAVPVDMRSTTFWRQGAPLGPEAQAEPASPTVREYPEQHSQR